MKTKMLVSIDRDLKTEFDQWAKDNSVCKSWMFEKMVRHIVGTQRITIVPDQTKEDQTNDNG